MYSQSQADSAGGPAVLEHESSVRHSTKEKKFSSGGGLDPPTANEAKHQSRRGIDPSVLSTKHGDESTIESLRRDPTKEVSSKSKSGRHVSSRSVMDPPYQNRGADPSECAFAPVESGNTAIQRAMNAHRKRSGNRRKASGSFKNTELAKEPVVRTASTSRRTSSTVASSKKPKKEVKIQGILKKKTATPPPIAYFGGTVVSSSSSSDEDSSSSSENGNDVESTVERDHDEKSLNSIKSGMRRGKYAAVNETAMSVTHHSNDDSDDSSIESNFECDETGEGNKFLREHSHFLRTADLGMTQDTIFAQQFLDNPSDSPQPHYHHPTPHPPPGVQFHVDENWICVDNGKGEHSPIAPQAVDGLVVMAYRTACDPMMWTPTAGTRKTMTEKRLRFDDLPIPGPLFEGEGSPIDSNCLIWHGKFPHKYYGSEIPAFRSQGIVNMSAEDLVDLIMDSNRVSEYNRSSIGRTDEVLLSDGSDHEGPFSGKRRKKLTGVVKEGTKIINGTAFDQSVDQFDDEDDDSSFEGFTIDLPKQQKSSQFVGVTKIVRSSNKVPLIKKTLQFTSLLHCRELSDEQGGNGYIIVARAITPADDVNRKEKGVMRSEVLLNVHIIRRLTGKNTSSSSSISSGKSVSSSNSGRVASKKELANRCLMITVSHVKSPLIPKILNKRVGLSAAANFMSDIRTANSR